MGKPSKRCKAWHAGDGGVGRDTLLGRMGTRRGTGHFGTGTYFVSSESRLGPAYSDREKRCIPIGRARLFKPDSDAAAQGLFDSLKAANESVAYGDFVSETYASEDTPTPAEQEARFSKIYRALKSSIPGLTGKAHKVSAVLEQASDDFEGCRRGDQELCAMDSASTRIMRAAGYEGVDVRGLDSFDNTMHGSVVYRRR